jgi:hypothetical protein
VRSRFCASSPRANPDSGILTEDKKRHWTPRTAHRIIS